MEALRAFCVKAEIPIVDIKMLLTHLSLIYRRKIRIGQSVDDHDSTTRALFSEENTDGKI